MVFGIHGFTIIPDSVRGMGNDKEWMKITGYNGRRRFAEGENLFRQEVATEERQSTGKGDNAAPTREKPFAILKSQTSIECL